MLLYALYACSVAVRRHTDGCAMSYCCQLFLLSLPLCVQGSQGVPVQPGSMLWLIQRDFLEGKSVQQLVKDALAPVPNPSHDMELDALNKIRASLASIAGNSTGEQLTPNKPKKG